MTILDSALQAMRLKKRPERGQGLLGPKPSLEELEQKINRMRVLVDLRSSPGWKLIKEEILAKRRESLIRTLTSDASLAAKPNEIIKTQAQVSTLDDIDRDLEYLIQEGVRAVETAKQLRNERRT